MTRKARPNHNAKSKNRLQPSSLAATVDEYIERQRAHLDEPASNLLTQLAENDLAAEAFENLKLANQAQKYRLLDTLIGAEQLARTFQRHLVRGKAQLGQIDRVLEAVAELRGFIDNIVADNNLPSSDRLSAKIIEPSVNVAGMRYGLSLIRDRALAGQRVVKEDQLRLGATRKKGMRQARQNAAIGWLAEGVRGITGRAHHLIVADLAQIILDTPVSLDRVKNAVRIRAQEWRQPINDDPDLKQIRRVQLPKS